MVERNSMTQARGLLEGRGTPVTSTLLEVCSTAVETFRCRRVEDKNIGNSHLAREIAHNIIKNIGQHQAVLVVADNERLSAWRKPTGGERPTNPSVEDLCLEIVQAVIMDVLTLYYEREATT